MDGVQSFKSLEPEPPELPQRPAEPASNPAPRPAPAPIAGDVISSSHHSRSYLLDLAKRHFQGVDNYDKYADALLAIKDDAPKPPTRTQKAQLKVIQSEHKKIINRPWPTEGVAQATEVEKSLLLYLLQIEKDRL